LNPALYLKNVKDIVQKEIKYLSNLYPYNLKRFIDTKLLHASSVLTFITPGSELHYSFLDKLVNLMAGIEILAIGVNLHSFNIDDFSFLTDKIGQDVNKLNMTVIEKNYTIDLLFGDIFYSRAVIYILRYGDFYIFDSILNSLKSVHEGRLFLHHKLVETVSKNNSSFMRLNKIRKHRNDFKKRAEELIIENEDLISGMNSILKTSFFIGWGIFSNTDKQGFPYSIINNFILLKTFNDLENFFANLPKNFIFLKNISYIKSKKQFLINELNKSIAGLELAPLRDNLKVLKKLYY